MVVELLREVWWGDDGGHTNNKSKSGMGDEKNRIIKKINKSLKAPKQAAEASAMEEVMEACNGSPMQTNLWKCHQTATEPSACAWKGVWKEAVVGGWWL